jgi:hypothetical protein
MATHAAATTFVAEKDPLAALRGTLVVKMVKYVVLVVVSHFMVI